MRLGRALRAAGAVDSFRDALTAVAADLSENPIDYGRRRRWWVQGWTIPDDDMARLHQQLIEARVARRDADWDLRRAALDVWVWAEVTCSYPRHSPTATRVNAAGRQDSTGVVAAYTAVRRQFPLPGHDIVRAYVGQVAARIEASPPGI